MTTYKTYRNGAGSLSADRQALSARIRAAVKNFYENHKVLPTSIAVHPAEVSAARGAVRVLALGLPVEGNEGCLAGEVWLAEVAE